MASKFIKAALVASVFTSSAGAAVAGDLGAALVGGIIGGVFMNEVNKSKRTRSRLPSTNQGRQIQSSLNYFGFNAGTVDGQLGRKSKTAISQYQAYIGYPSTGALSDLEFDFLTSSYQRAIASGPLATQQAMGHPDGTRGLLRVYMQERLALQQQMQQQQMLQYAGQQPLGAVQYGVPNGAVAIPGQQGVVPQQGQGMVYAKTGQPQAYVPQGQQLMVQQGQQQLTYAAPQMVPQAYRPQAAAGGSAVGVVPQPLPQQGHVAALQQPTATTQSQAGVFAAPSAKQPQGELVPLRRRVMTVGVKPAQDSK